MCLIQRTAEYNYVLKNMIKGVPNYLIIKENISKDTFPNLFKMI
jgi:hypothetical protein